MRARTTGQKVMALAGFFVLGLSPSFVDWEQEKDNPRRRWQIAAYYAVALPLIYCGALK